MNEPMKIRVDKYDAFVEIKLEEERLDSSVSPRFKSDLVMLHSEGCVNMLLDLTAVSYIDSSGLSALLVANRLCAGSGGKLVLTGLTPFVTGLLQIARLDALLQGAPELALGRLEVSGG
ncbi:MAG: STAS domain-containing protein [Bacteroidota bacterium]